MKKMSYKDNALRTALKFLLACSRGAQPSPKDFKRLADLCGIALPVRHRLTRQEFDAINRATPLTIKPYSDYRNLMEEAMDVTVNFNGFADELKSLAESEHETVEDLVQRVVLVNLRVFLLGQMKGQKVSHERAMEIIGNIGKKPTVNESGS
jgi:hypothetical protein